MPFIRTPPSWQLPACRSTPESVFLNRRRFMKLAAGASVGAGIGAIASCYRAPLTDEGLAELQKTYGRPLRNVAKPAEFAGDDLTLTEQRWASRYNNFYEFGHQKTIWQAAQALPTDPWTVEVSGLVKTPKTYDLDDLYSAFPLEERVYRFRCVEAWAMVVPWIGFPMRSILAAVEPTAAAKFVRFESYYDPAVTPGPAVSFSNLPWPYHEALRIEEMANELAFFAVGVYGRTLPKQHGAPLRMVVPWKYGFKGAKSIVKIEFTDTQPATYWNTISPNEYGFESNVNPDVSHPRWSQKTERLISEGSSWDWPRQDTLLYNGYGEYVADLYA